jgi:hypothetical protein
MVTTELDTNSYALFDYRLDHEKWLRYRIGNPATYASIASDTPATLDVVFTSVVVPRSAPVLLETVSRDDGAHWSTPRQVVSTHAGEPQHPRILALNGHFAVLWIEVAADGSAVLRRANRDTESPGWTQVDSLLLDQAPTRFFAVANRCGAIMALMQFVTAEGGQLHPHAVEATWSSWRSHAHLRPFPADQEALELGASSVGDDFVTAFAASHEAGHYEDFTGRRAACPK